MTHRKTIPFNERGRETIHILIASLIGDKDQTRYVGQDLRLLDYPKEFAFEKVVIEAIYASTPPTEKNVVRFLQENKGISEGLDDLLRPILEIRKEIGNRPTQEVIQQAWANFWGWWQGVVFADTLDWSHKLQISSVDMTDEEKRQIIQKKLNQTMPTMRRTETYVGHEEMGRAATEKHQKLMDYEESGISAYPRFPIEKMNKKLGGLAPGDPMLITSGSKMGKTTLSSVFGEYAAWHEGYYVLNIALETDVTAFWRRFVARAFGIPTVLWRQPLETTFDGRKITIPKVNMKHPYWAEVLSPDSDRVRQYQEFMNEAGGAFVLEKATGWSVPSITGLVMRHIRKAEQMSRPILVMLDYLQRSVWGNLQDGKELELLISYSNAWKDFAESTGICSIMFSQETDGGKSGETKAYGSRIPGTVFQSHLSIKRPVAEKDGVCVPERVLDPATNEHLYNAVGERRWYAAEDGDLTGLGAYLKIERANEGGRGNIPFWTESGLYNLVDPEHCLDERWGVKHYEPLDLSRFVK